ncbi:MAG: NHL repeat-containing protein [Bacteroidota bacterium]
MTLDTPSRAKERQQEHAPTIPGTSRHFLGEANNPLLAPRGVHLINGKLIVADTGQNRVFIWNQLPESPYADADVVLGQTEANSTARNAGGQAGASTLLYPSGLWSDGQKLVVCDAWNHRVLIWSKFPSRHGQPADIVLGQPDFTSHEPNVGGVSSLPTAKSLNWPYGVDSDGQRLFIADTGNRRVLIFNSWPEQSYEAASHVIGKSGFSDRDYDHHQPIWPYSVKLGPKGQLAIADTQYYRVLLYASWKKAIEQTANQEPVIIGQASISDNGQNQFRWFPEANTLNWCYDACFWKDGLLVADTGNSRVLHFSEVPTENNTHAEALLGQATFQLGIENRNSIQATPDSLYWPFHLAIDDHTLVIADTGNHRIVIHELSQI